MTPAKSVLLGIGMGGVAYVLASNPGNILQRSSQSALVSDTMVTESLAPSAKVVPRGAKSSVTTLAPPGTRLAPSVTNVAPSLSPPVTTVAPVIPRITAIPTASATPSPTPSTVVTPRPATPTPSPSLTPTPTPVPTSAPIPTPSPTPTIQPSPTAAPSQVVINEIAWAGTAAQSSDEWLELYNAGDVAVDLLGWAIYTGDTKMIELSGTISAGAYFLIERTDDTTVSDIGADVFGPFGGSGLSNSGEQVTLRTGAGAIVDTVDCSSGWFNVDTASAKQSMERISALTGGSVASNWASNTGSVSTGLDVAGAPLAGTPKYRNSVAQP